MLNAINVWLNGWRILSTNAKWHETALIEYFLFWSFAQIMNLWRNYKLPLAETANYKNQIMFRSLSYNHSYIYIQSIMLKQLIIMFSAWQKIYRVWSRTSKQTQWRRQSWCQGRVRKFLPSWRWSPAKSSLELSRTLTEKQGYREAWAVTEY